MYLLAMPAPKKPKVSQTTPSSAKVVFQNFLRLVDPDDQDVQNEAAGLFDYELHIAAEEAGMHVSEGGDSLTQISPSPYANFAVSIATEWEQDKYGKMVLRLVVNGVSSEPVAIDVAYNRAQKAFTAIGGRDGITLAAEVVCDLLQQHLDTLKTPASPVT